MEATEDDAAGQPGGSEFETWLGRETAHQRAAETKKRRTREKLIHAADAMMRDQGWSTTVDQIAEDAGVSVANFYNYFTSRNVLCLDAVLELVVAPLEGLGIADKPFQESAEALLKQCEGRAMLMRAAMSARLDQALNFQHHTLMDDLLQRVANLLDPHLPLTAFSLPEAFEGKANAHVTAVKLAALWLLDSVAMNLQPDMPGLKLLFGLTLPATTA